MLAIVVETCVKHYTHTLEPVHIDHTWKDNSLVFVHRWSYIAGFTYADLVLLGK